MAIWATNFIDHKLNEKHSFSVKGITKKHAERNSNRFLRSPRGLGHKDYTITQIKYWRKK